MSTMVTIQITDINDNTPQFYLCTYLACNFSAPPEGNFSGQIEEHASARTPVANLNIVAYDPDKVGTGRKVAEIRGGGAGDKSLEFQEIIGLETRVDIYFCTEPFVFFLPMTKTSDFNYW